MGVGIKELVDDVKETITYKDLNGKTLALDAFNILYQFLSAIRQQDGSYLMDSKGNITSHLSGIFYRSISLMENNIKLIYVFDGEKPSFKKEEIEKREKAREEAREKWMESLEKGEIEEARKYAQGAVFITPEMVEESKELISAMGMAFVDAPSEGEAEASYLVNKGVAYAVASQDYDSLLFGTPILIRNIAISGKRKIPGTMQYKEIHTERIFLEKLLEKHSLTREQLICLGIIVGCDYAPGGVEGYGVKKALEVVRTYKQPERIAEVLKDKWKHEAEFIEIFDFFLNPPVQDVEVKFNAIDEDKIWEILVERHEFSEERVKNALERLKKAKGKVAQKTLF